MYEHHSSPLLSISSFLRRVINHSVIALLAIAFALMIGVSGYHFIEGLPWIDALLNASMLLGGMGPVSPIQTTAGKLFASFYALFAGLMFVGVAGILLAPFMHRILHVLHAEPPKE